MTRKRNTKKNIEEETTKVEAANEQPTVEPTEEQTVEETTKVEAANEQPTVEPTEEQTVEETKEVEAANEQSTEEQPKEVVEPVEEDKEVVEPVEEAKEVVEPVEEQPEVEPEETQEVLTGITQEQAKVAAMLDKQDIDALLVKPGMDIEDKLKVILDKAIPSYKQLTAKLLGYVEVMGVGIVDPNIGVGKQLDLVSTLKSAVETKDSGEFKTKLDIINLAFMAYKDSALNIYKIYRFDDKWKWNKKDLTTLQHLTMVISTLASLATRKENLKKVDLEKALNKGEVNLSADAINNIKSYYKA